MATTFVDSTRLTALVPASLLTSPVTAGIVVQIGDPMDFFTQTNTVTFSVTSPVPATISPSSDTVGPRAERQFVFAINGNTASATWMVQEGAAAGTISSGGLYTAPNTDGTYHVVAASAADPSVTASSTVSVADSGFTLTGSMSNPRNGHTATLLPNGKVLVAGGASGELDASAEIYDPASGIFAPTGSMTTSRAGATATLLANGKVLVAGGYGSGASTLPILNSAELYDPQSGTFAATGSMAVARKGPTATLLNDGRILIAGGIESGGGGGVATASTEIYDPAKGTFTISGSMLSARASHTATLLASGKVLILGGWNGHRADSSDDPPWDPLFAELFDPTSGSLTESGSMSATRIGPSSIRLPDGKVLVLGGVPTLQNIHEQPSDPQYAELYDPSAGTFSSAGSFTVSRTGYTATLLINGTVLIVGGEQGGIAVTWAVLLDPATGGLTDTGGLVTARRGHTATRLNDGRVLVIGGTDINGNALASAELYQ